MRNLSAKTRLTAALATAAVSGLLLAGCSAPTTGTDTGTGTGSSDTGTLSIGLGDTLTNLYPGIEAGVVNYWIANAVAEGLVAVNSEGELVPALATEWQQTDPTTYVFQIDQNAVFQDGTPLTIDDVLVSIENARDPEVSASIVTWGNVDTVEQTGDWEITITLLAPDASFIFGPSASAGLFVFPASYWQDAGDALGTAEALPIATGPYQITAFAPDSSITLERSEHWNGEEGAYETIVLDMIPNENTRLLAIQSGTIDISLSVPLPQIAQWQQSDDVEVTVAPNRSYTGLTFDTTVAPFDDKNVRDAVAHSFDRQAVVDQVLGGYAEVATALLTPAQLSGAHSPDEARTLLADMQQYPFDLEKAAAALAASSVPDGFTTELVYPDSIPELGLSAELLKQNLSEIGVTLTTRSVTTNEWFGTMADREHGIGFMSYTTTSADPAEMTNWFLGTPAEFNLTGWQSDEVAAAVAAAGAADSLEEQLERLIESNRLQAAENVYAPLWWGEMAIASNSSVAFDDFTSYTLFGQWPLALTPTA